jgi:hypothetical protein
MFKCTIFQFNAVWKTKFTLTNVIIPKKTCNKETNKEKEIKRTCNV